MLCFQSCKPVYEAQRATLVVWAPAPGEQEFHSCWLLDVAPTQGSLASHHIALSPKRQHNAGVVLASDRHWSLNYSLGPKVVGLALLRGRARAAITALLQLCWLLLQEVTCRGAGLPEWGMHSGVAVATAAVVQSSSAVACDALPSVLCSHDALRGTLPGVLGQHLLDADNGLREKSCAASAR